MTALSSSRWMASPKSPSFSSPSSVMKMFSGLIWENRRAEGLGWASSGGSSQLGGSRQPAGTRQASNRPIHAEARGETPLPAA